MAIKQTKLSNKANDQLTELSKLRKLNGDVIKSKQGIVEYLIDKLHKKECLK